MKSPKYTIGKAFSRAGQTLVGIGVVPEVAGAGNSFLRWMAVAGFLSGVIGVFLSELFVEEQTALISASQTTQQPVPTKASTIQEATAIIKGTGPGN